MRPPVARQVPIDQLQPPSPRYAGERARRGRNVRMKDEGGRMRRNVGDRLHPSSFRLHPSMLPLSPALSPAYWGEVAIHRSAGDRPPSLRSLHHITTSPLIPTPTPCSFPKRHVLEDRQMPIAKVIQELSGEDFEAFNRWLAESARTLDASVAWLGERVRHQPQRGAHVRARAPGRVAVEPQAVPEDRRDAGRRAAREYEARCCAARGRRWSRRRGGATAGTR